VQPNSEWFVHTAVADEAREELDAFSDQRRNVLDPLIRQTDAPKEDLGMRPFERVIESTPRVDGLRCSSESNPFAR
jgi:hypothetical protein